MNAVGTHPTIHVEAWVRLRPWDDEDDTKKTPCASVHERQQSPGIPEPHCSTRPSLRDANNRRGFVTPTETDVPRDAVCFMVKAWARHKITETIMNKGWRLAAVGGWQLVGGGGWRLAAVGGWRFVAAVLTKKKQSS